MRLLTQPTLSWRRACHGLEEGKSWMSPDVSAEVRARIVEKLRLGTLPKERPRFLKPSSTTDTKAEWRIGTGPAGKCAACDAPIREGETFEAFHVRTGGEVRMHDSCGRTWEEERHRVRQA
jgi:hypothetical protein